MEHRPMPVAGYTSQPDWKIQLVNVNKSMEEETLRVIDQLETVADIDKRWLAIGKTYLELAFMAVNRAIFKPQRVKDNG